MKASPATAEDIARWDELVIATGQPHLTQSTAWADVKALTGWEARRFVFDGGVGVAQVLVRRLPLGISIAYSPRGPLVAPPTLTDAIVALRHALASERCASLLCDPEVTADAADIAALERAGIHRSPVYVQPRRTLLMDLAVEPEAALAAMRKKTRQYIHKAERSGVVTEETRDLDRFLRALRKVAERDRFALHSREYFASLLQALGDRAHILIARVGDDDCGVLMLARMADRAWELYGGWSGEHGESRPFYLLKWRAMRRMHALGAVRYDMWGLADSPDDALAGVENFKLGFGGAVTEWIGALETPVRAALYPIWQLAGRRRLARSAA